MFQLLLCAIYVTMSLAKHVGRLDGCFALRHCVWRSSSLLWHWLWCYSVKIQKFIIPERDDTEHEPKVKVLENTSHITYCTILWHPGAVWGCFIKVNSMLKSSHKTKSAVVFKNSVALLKPRILHSNIW